MTTKRPQNKWGRRTFTPQQWLKRDIRSAATRSAKSGIKPTLPTLRFMQEDSLMTQFRVRGFWGERLLIETHHSTESSAYVEIEAWRTRIRRGEASHAELIDLRPGGRLTNLRVYPHTEIPWSWKGTKHENSHRG